MTSDMESKQDEEAVIKKEWAPVQANVEDRNDSRGPEVLLHGAATNSGDLKDKIRGRAEMADTLYAELIKLHLTTFESHVKQFHEHIDRHILSTKRHPIAQAPAKSTCVAAKSSIKKISPKTSILPSMIMTTLVEECADQRGVIATPKLLEAAFERLQRNKNDLQMKDQLQFAFLLNLSLEQANAPILEPMMMIYNQNVDLLLDWLRPACNASKLEPHESQLANVLIKILHTFLPPVKAERKRVKRLLRDVNKLHGQRTLPPPPTTLPKPNLEKLRIHFIDAKNYYTCYFATGKKAFRGDSREAVYNAVYENMKQRGLNLTELLFDP